MCMDTVAALPHAHIDSLHTHTMDKEESNNINNNNNNNNTHNTRLHPHECINKLIHSVHVKDNIQEAN